MSDMMLILYTPKGCGTLTIALYITIYSTYTCINNTLTLKIGIIAFADVTVPYFCTDL